MQPSTCAYFPNETLGIIATLSLNEGGKNCCGNMLVNTVARHKRQSFTAETDIKLTVLLKKNNYLMLKHEQLTFSKGIVPPGRSIIELSTGSSPPVSICLIRTHVWHPSSISATHRSSISLWGIRKTKGCWWVQSWKMNIRSHTPSCLSDVPLSLDWSAMSTRILRFPRFCWQKSDKDGLFQY